MVDPSNVVDVPEMVRRMKKKLGVSYASMARVTGVPRETLSRLAGEKHGCTGFHMTNAVQLYRMAWMNGVDIPMVKRESIRRTKKPPR